jgi:hypothetical protein
MVEDMADKKKPRRMLRVNIVGNLRNKSLPFLPIINFARGKPLSVMKNKKMIDAPATSSMHSPQQIVNANTTL